jgi:hypothetical protein
MAEFTDPPTAAIPAPDRDFIRTHEAPPPSWTICVGRYFGGAFAPGKFRYNHHGFHLNGPGGTDLLQCTTIVLDALIMQAVSSTAADLVTAYRDDYIPRNMLVLWPASPSDRSWPSTLLLEDREADLIAKTFATDFLSTKRPYPKAGGAIE